MNGFSNRRRTSWALVLAVLFASPAWVRADDSTPDCYILAIGVDNYARVNKLRGCVNDARGVAGQFVAQQGKRFRKVTSRVLTDREATRAAVGRGLEWLSGAGQAGDFAVLFLSGHGTPPQQGGWRFLVHDYDPKREGETSLGDAEILRRASALADRGLKVLVIVDACHSGQLRRSAADALNRHRNPSGGGLVLMLSSMPSQTSAALGPYSAFARAVVEGLAGEADVDGNGYVTLRELRRYAYHRTYQLLRQKGLATPQDGECDWSLSVSEELRLAVAGPRVPVEFVGTTWSGREELAGYGKMSFRFLKGNRVVMQDAKDSSEGTWQRKGNKLTLKFNDGRVVYQGTVSGTSLSGTASNGRNSWTWSVRLQGSARAALRPESD
jgi:hypothetical protein